MFVFDDFFPRSNYGLGKIKLKVFMINSLPIFHHARDMIEFGKVPLWFANLANKLENI